MRQDKIDFLDFSNPEVAKLPSPLKAVLGGKQVGFRYLHPLRVDPSAQVRFTLLTHNLLFRSFDLPLSLIHVLKRPVSIISVSNSLSSVQKMRAH